MQAFIYISNASGFHPAKYFQYIALLHISRIENIKIPFFVCPTFLFRKKWFSLKGILYKKSKMIKFGPNRNKIFGSVRISRFLHILKEYLWEKITFVKIKKLVTKSVFGSVSVDRTGFNWPGSVSKCSGSVSNCSGSVFNSTGSVHFDRTEIVFLLHRS